MSNSWVWTNDCFKKTKHTICLEPCGMAIDVLPGSTAKYTAYFETTGQVEVEQEGNDLIFYPGDDWSKCRVEVDGALVYEFP